MNKYFVKWGRAGNEYSLMYTQDGSTPDGYEQITREKAQYLARKEVRARKEDPAFAYRADTYIYPAEMTEKDIYDFECGRRWHSEGRIVVKSK